MQDPERRLASQFLSFHCPVHPGRQAVLDPDHRAFVGHDLFFFSDTTSRARFERDPLHWCRTLSDPVTLRRFAVNRRSPMLTLEGRRYYFESDSTRGVFAAMPDSFALRKGM